MILGAKCSLHVTTDSERANSKTQKDFSDFVSAILKVTVLPMATGGTKLQMTLEVSVCFMLRNFSTFQCLVATNKVFHVLCNHAV